MAVWLKELLAKLKKSMQIKAEQKFIRISPRKVRLVASAIKRLPLDDAKQQLKVLGKRAALPLRKTITQAIANATNNFKQDEKDLSIKEIQIGEGPTYKRWQPVSRGRAHSILKRTSHIKVILQSKNIKPKLTKPAKPVSKVKKSTKKE